MIKFEVNPSPEEVATAEAQGHATIPTNSGVIIVLENEDQTPNKGKGKKRRREEPEVELISGPSVRFPEYLKRPPPIDTQLLDLRRHVLIAQVNYYNASTRFFDQATSLLPHIKRMVADMPFGKGGETKSKEPDHVYAFPSSSHSNESDCDI